MMLRSLARAAALAVALVSFATVAGAQVADPALTKALERVKADNAWTLDQQQSICQIPAPPFKEQARGLEMKRRFVALGYTNVSIDAEGNVIAERQIGRAHV